MVWSWKPRSHKIWYTGAPLTVRPDEGRTNEKVAEKGAQRFEIAPCRTEIGACGPPRGGHERRRRKRNLDVLGIGSAAPLLSYPEPYRTANQQYWNRRLGNHAGLTSLVGDAGIEPATPPV